CDESKPECGNCVQFGVNCDFTPCLLRPRTSSIPSPAPRRGRPRLDWASWAQQIALSTAAEGHPRIAVAPFTPLNADDIEIYHHYITQAAAALAEPGNESGRRLWSEGAPRLGFRYPCILDLMLAFSAYHMARDRALDDAARLNLVAEHHCTAALREATALLRTYDESSSPALYIISVLVCFTALAQGPRPGDLLLVACDGQVPWLSLIRGVRLVISTSGWASIFAGPLAEYAPVPQAGDDRPKSMAREPGVEAGREDWRVSLNNVVDLIDLCAQPETKKQYKADLSVLEGCFEATFIQGHHAQPHHVGKMQSVMMWIYQLQEPLVKGLQEKEPVPLILLGHFCVLLHTLRSYWFIEGWARHVLGEILQASEASRRWLTWPLQFVDISSVGSQQKQRD
ncbi:hypothetical protein Micbo1qcDRAFT_125277, partial [Microdochium bolleyi]